MWSRFGWVVLKSTIFMLAYMLHIQVKDIKKELGDQINLEFRESFSSTTGSMHVKQMSEACLVLDVLEPHVKHDLLQWFVTLQLKEYGVLFDENEDLAWLDKVVNTLCVVYYLL
jgi:hypothetical protein